MKTAIYIEDGLVQLVITPESEFEKGALKSFSDKPMNAQMFTGTFYDCRGGWVRQTNYYPNTYGSGSQDDQSLIIRMNTATENKDQP